MAEETEFGNDDLEVLPPAELEEDGGIAFDDEEDAKYQDRLKELKEIAARWVKEGKKGTFSAKDLAKELDEEE